MLVGVELLNRAHAEMFVELVRALQVGDVNCKDMLPIWCAVELDAVILRVHIDVLIGLKRDSDVPGQLLSLKWIQRVIESGVTPLKISVEVQPSKELHVSNGIDPIGFEAFIRPGFAPEAVIGV